MLEDSYLCEANIEAAQIMNDLFKTMEFTL